MAVGMPRHTKCFLINRSVPYQLKPGVLWPIRGKCTLAVVTSSISHHYKIISTSFPAGKAVDSLKPVVQSRGYNTREVVAFVPLLSHY